MQNLRSYTSSFRGNRALLYGATGALISIVLVASFVAMRYWYKQVENRAVISLQSLAKSTELGFSGLIETIDFALLDSADDISMEIVHKKPDGKLITRILSRQAERLKHAAFIRATNERGDIIYGPGIVSPPVNISDRDYFIRVRDDANATLFVSKPVFARIDQTWIWLFARRINKPDGSFGGVVFASIRVDDILAILAKIKMETTNIITLRNADLGLVARYSNGRFFYPSDDKGVSAELADALKNNRQLEPYFVRRSRIDGDSHLYTFVQNEKFGFIVNVGNIPDAIFKEWRDQAWGVGSLVSVFIILLLSTAAIISRSWLRQEKNIFELNASKTYLLESEERLIDAQRIALLGSYNYDLRNDTWTSSEILDEILGIGPDYLRNAQGWLALVATESRQEMQTYLENLIEKRQSFDREFQIIRPCDGKERWVHGKGVLQLNEDGTPFSMMGTIQDITDRKRTDEKLILSESALKRQNNLLESLLKALPIGVFMVEVPSGKPLVANDAALKLLGRGILPDANKENLSDAYKAYKIGSSGPYPIDEMPIVLGMKGQTSHIDDMVIRRPDNSMSIVEVYGTPIMNEEGNIWASLVSFSDISQRKEHEAELKRIAYYDSLTNLPNRVLLADRLNLAMAQTRRRGQPLAVAYLDLDDFKPINDRHGHEVGDQMLMELANRMKQALREGDTLARLGGDEFIAVLLDVPNIKACEPMLNRLLAAACQPTQIGDFMLEVSASVGVAFYPQSEDMDADQLLRQADNAMYQAKQAGKNRYHLFDAEQDRSVRSYHEILTRIRQALSSREFVLHYQPKVNLVTGKIFSVEALIRWQHPEKGLLSPVTFLPYLEGSDLEVAVGEWVIDTALKQIETWSAAGLTLSVSINISANHLLQPNFSTNLDLALKRHPTILPSGLVLEILETAAISDMSQAVNVLTRCRELGVLISLDDFGTGYSSLTYLRTLPVDILKIDQSFIRDMLTDPSDMGIIISLIQLAKTFNLIVIAEGVETLEHGAMLVQLGCTLMQGYGIARPMPANQMSGWIGQWRDKAIWLSLDITNKKS